MHLFGIGIGGEGDASNALEEDLSFFFFLYSFSLPFFFFLFTFETFKTTLLRCLHVRYARTRMQGGREEKSASLYFRFPIVSSLQRRPATPL